MTTITARAIIAALTGKQSESTQYSTITVSEKIDFSKEQASAYSAYENSKKPSMISRLSMNGNYYHGSSPTLIEYASSVLSTMMFA